MTDADRDRLAAHIRGTCQTVEQALEQLDIKADPEVAEDKLLDVNIECCKGCGWWDESCMLDKEKNGVVGYCDQCAPEN